MPLTVRLGQCTLEVLGRYIGATGVVDSSRKVHRVEWKNIPIPIQLVLVIQL